MAPTGGLPEAFLGDPPLSLHLEQLAWPQAYLLHGKPFDRGQHLSCQVLGAGLACSGSSWAGSVPWATSSTAPILRFALLSYHADGKNHHYKFCFGLGFFIFFT